MRKNKSFGSFVSGVGKESSQVLQRAVIIFGLSYFFWLVFYFDFLKESLGSVARLIAPSALILVPLGVIVLFCALAVVAAVLTWKVKDRSFVRGVVASGVLLNMSSLVSIGLGSPLAWASLAIGLATLLAAWKLPTRRLVSIALIVGVVGTGYAWASQGLWTWSHRPLPEPVTTNPTPSLNVAGHLPSVYIIVMDEMSLSLINKYTSFMSLPNLSRLAKEGVYFPRAYGVSDETAMSIGSAFTGKYLEEQLSLGRAKDAWLRDHRNLVTDLITLGYRIKVYNDIFAFGARFPTSPLRVETESTPVVSGGDLTAFAVKHLARQVTFGLYRAPNIGALLQGQPARVFDFEHTPDNPQLVYLHLFDAHHEYSRNRDGSLHNNPYTLFANPWDEEAAPKVADNYFEQILWADTLASPLVDSLLAIPPEERIVVFLSDHGISWREPPFGRGLGFLQSTQLNIPLVILAPGLAPTVDAQLLPLIDLYPTIVDLLNRVAGKTVLAPPKDIDGLSLFADEASRQARSYYAYSGYSKYRLQQDNWVLEKLLKAGAQGAHIPIPAQELALSVDATQYATASTVLKPLPAMELGRAKSALLPPKESIVSGEIGIFLVEEDYLGYNILYTQRRFYGIRGDEGEFSLEKFRAGSYANAIEGASLEEVKEKIDSLPPGAWVAKLIAEGYKGYNIIRLRYRYYGIRQGDGDFSLEKFQAGGYSYAVEGTSVEEVKRKIDEISQR